KPLSLGCQRGMLRKVMRPFDRAHHIRRESRPLDSGNIQRLSESPRFWIPTFVGMTGFEIAAFIGKNRNRSAVIPAQAGI
ncbi:hypothetical protein, partial [Neisseria meningitidis]|uniref:hypothetical protein n=1 Tax=Neisseria meningitidis TaxID=487 RepID=UPI0009A946D3